MEQSKIEDILLRIIKVGIFATLFTPLIFGPFGINFVEYPKAVFFRSLMEIVFAFYIALVLFNKKYLPKKSLLLASLLIFYAVMFVASIFGTNFYRSFFGDMPRGEGLIMHLHLLAFFIIITSVFIRREEWLKLFKVSILVSGLSSLAAILQQINVASFYTMDYSRLSGTMSNPDLFSCYIALSIFLAIFVLVAESNRNFKILWSFLIILNCYTLFFSYTRGSWLGVIAGFIVLIILNFYRLTSRHKIFISLGLLTIFIIALIFFLNLDLFKNSSSIFISRITNIINLSGRTDIWRAAIIAIENKPILGWGFESFAFISDKYMSGFSNGIYFDRVHNKFLELLVYGGIIGFFAYFLIFSVIFYLIFKNIQLWDGYNNRPKIVYASILLAFFVAGLVQNISAFDNIGTYILFFLVAGFINNNYANNLEEKHFNEENYKLPYLIKFFVIIIVFLITIIIFYEVNLKPTVAAMYFPGSIVYEKSDAQRALRGYEEAINMNTFYDNDLRLAFAEKLIYFIDGNYSNDFKEKIYKDLLKVKPFLYQDIKSRDEQPNHLYQIYAVISEAGYILHKDVNDLNDMSKTLNEAILFNPNVADNYQLMGELKILQNNDSEGEKYLKKSCTLDGSDDVILYKRIGAAYLKKGDSITELQNLEKVIDINFESKKQTPESAEIALSNAQFIDYVASIYCGHLNDVKNCKRIYDKGSEIYPEYAGAFKNRFETTTSKNR